MYDRKLTTYSEIFTKDVAIGQPIPDEGAVLVFVEEDGIQKVKRSGGVLNETLAGFSAIDNYQPATEVKVETGAVPKAPGPYVVTLSHASLVAGQIRIYDVDADVDLVEGNPAIPGEYSVIDTTGVITFNAAETLHTVIVYYRYDLTVMESVMTYHQRHANAGASAFLDVCEVMGGQGEMWTDQYDVSKDYSGLTPNQLRSGVNGIITVGGFGAPLGIVIGFPNVNSKYLGVKYTIRNLVGA